MKFLKIVAQWLFILCLPLLLLTAGLSIAMNTKALYEYGFGKYDIAQRTGIAPEELTKAANGLISYFNSDEEYINLTVTKDGQPFTLFNDREVQHLKDVKGLFWLGYYVLIGTGTYALIFMGVTLLWWRDRRRFGWGLFGGGVLTLALMALIGVIAAVDFTWFFTQFHLLSFANDLWLLNPATDYLLMMFPEGFWFDAVMYIAIGVGVTAIILAGLGWWRRR